MSALQSFYKTWFETQENKWKTGLVGMIIITIMLAGVFNHEASAIPVIDENELKQITQSIVEGIPTGEWREAIAPGTTSGYTNEQDSTDEIINIDQETLTEVSCTIRWTDEPSIYFQGTNEPDEFKVAIIAPNGDILDESSMSTSGSVTATAALPNYEETEDFADIYLGEWTIRIEAGDCGDDIAFLPFGGIRTTPDNGNDWDLEYTYQFMELVETTG